MKTCTAQILLGYEDPYHGGIQPFSQIFLKEDSKSVLELKNINKSDNEIVWTASLDNTLEDILLMTGVHICKEDNLINTVKNLSKKNDLNYIDMNTDFTKEQRQHLYKICRTINPFVEKIIFSIFELETSLYQQITKPKYNILKKYHVKKYQVVD